MLVLNLQAHNQQPEPAFKYLICGISCLWKQNVLGTLMNHNAHP